MNRLTLTGLNEKNRKNGNAPVSSTDFIGGYSYLTPSGLVPCPTLNALRELLSREKEKKNISLKDELLEIGKQCAALPVLDNRCPEEILGYNENGVTN